MTTAPREIPILFSSPMVRAILEGRKTQTRRVCKLAIKLSADYPSRKVIWNEREQWWEFQGCLDGCKCKRCRERFVLDCRYGKPGDVLYVRETLHADDEGDVTYAADDAEVIWPEGSGEVWDYHKGTISSIHMPKFAARLWLEVTDVRVERLHQITEADAKAEGFTPYPILSGIPALDAVSMTGAFMNLWQTINGKKYPWSSNPWVWCVSFKRLAGRPS